MIVLSQPNRLVHIDAWRLIAVTLVIVSHILKFSNPWYRENLPWIVMARAQGLGSFGVKIFFCISGFVICRGLLAEQRARGTVSIKAFYIRRFLRILPPLFLYMAGLALLTAMGLIDVRPSQFAHAGLFLCNVYLDECGWLLAHTWSLAFEEQFYLFFPLLFVVAPMFGGRRAILVLTVVLICFALLAIVADLGNIAFALGTFVCMLVGCVTAMYWQDIAPVVTGLSVRAWLSLVAVTVVIGNVVIWPEPMAAAMNVLLLPVLLSAMVLSTPVGSPRVAAVFLHPRVAYLGKISFTLYLWQQLATSQGFIQSPWLNAVALGATLLIAILSYRFLERPLMRVGATLSTRMVASEDRPLRAARP